MNDEEIIGKLPDPDEVIESYRKQYASYSRAQLIREMNRWLPHAHQHIAAKQLLDEMDTAYTDKQHKQNLEQSRKATFYAKWAFIIGLLSLLAFLAEIAYRTILSVTNTNPKTEKLKSKSEQPSSATEIVQKTTNSNHTKQGQDQLGLIGK